MAITINDGLSINAPKPSDARFTVGTGKVFTSKENIPASYRYEYMTVTDDNGTKWRLEGGIANANWFEESLYGGTF